MKLINLALAAACLITSTSLGTTSAVSRPLPPEVADRTCGQVETLSRDIMASRQLGMSMSEVMAMFTKHLSDHPRMLAVMRSVIIWAYDMKAYQEEVNQERAKTDFATEVARRCYEVYEAD